MAIGNAAGISFGGLGSGINVNSIIQALIQADSVQLNSWQTQIQNLQSQQQTYTNFQSTLTALSTSLASLNSTSAFQSATATSGTPATLTVTADSTATQGTYNVTVTNLAAAQKIASAAQTNSTDSLNQTGTFIVNGKAVTVASSDTLQNVASKINALGAGVTASIINGGTGSTYMTLTSSQSGTANAMQLSDASGSILNSLGLLGGTTSLRSTSGTKAFSSDFTSATTSLGTLTGYSGSGSFSVDGNAIPIDFSSDSLQTIANKINTSGGSVRATVDESTSNGTTSYHLTLDGTNVKASLTDTNGLLNNIGVLQNAPVKSLQDAQDAAYTIDGLSSFTSSTNTVTSAIPGVTLSLLAKGTSQVSVTQSTDSIASGINAFVKSYNDVANYISTNSQFDSKTFQTGALFGDQLATQVQNGLNSLLYNQVGNGSIRSLADMGISLGQDGTLSVDSTKLTAALTNHLSDVKNVLMSSATTTNANLTYITSGTATKSSGGAGYNVNVTQVATQGQTNAASAQTVANAGGEILTFTGTPFGSSGYQLFVDIGATQQDLVSKINSDATLKGSVVASVDGSGKLQIQSKRYGTAGNFGVSSNFAAAANNSGIGTTGGTRVDGVDIAGTINGEAATGTGQYLLGKTGNATTDGLEVQYTGATTGTIGSVNYQNGIAASLITSLSAFTDATNGLFATTNSSLQKQIDDFNTQITTENTRLSQETQDLQQKYAAMDSAISAFQAQSRQLTSMGF